MLLNMVLRCECVDVSVGTTISFAEESDVKHLYATMLFKIKLRNFRATVSSYAAPKTPETQIDDWRLL